MDILLRKKAYDHLCFVVDQLKGNLREYFIKSFKQQRQKKQICRENTETNADKRN